MCYLARATTMDRSTLGLDPHPVPDPDLDRNLDRNPGRGYIPVRVRNQDLVHILDRARIQVRSQILDPAHNQDLDRNQTRGHNRESEHYFFPDLCRPFLDL